MLVTIVDFQASTNVSNQLEITDKTVHAIVETLCFHVILT